MILERISYLCYSFLSPHLDGIKPVDTKTVANKFSTALQEIKNLLDNVVMPLAVICSVTSVFLIIFGKSTKSSNLKKTGFIFLAGDLIGIIVWFALPLFIGFAKYLGSMMGG